MQELFILILSGRYVRKQSELSARLKTSLGGFSSTEVRLNEFSIEDSQNGMKRYANDNVCLHEYTVMYIKVRQGQS